MTAYDENTGSQNLVFTRKWKILDAWGWCTVMTQRDDMGRVVGVGFRVGNSCTPVVDSCQCMAKPIQYCKVKKKLKKEKKKTNPNNLSTLCQKSDLLMFISIN